MTEFREQEVARQVLQHHKFQRMAKQKSIVGWTFSLVMFFVYVTYIWVIGTNPQLFATKVAEGSIITLGIYAGVAVIVFSFVITLLYVWLANGRFDKSTQEVVEEVMGENK